VVVRLEFEDIGLQIVGFYNPRVKHYYVMARDPITGRWVFFVRELSVCATCTFHTPVPEGKHWSKGLLVEGQACVTLHYSTWWDFEYDDEFLLLLEEAAEEAPCKECFDLFGVDYEIAGWSLYYEPEEYCRKYRADTGALVRDYTKQAFRRA